MAAQNSAQTLQMRGFQARNILDGFVLGDSRLGSAGPRGLDPDFCFENYLKKVQFVIVVVTRR